MSEDTYIQCELKHPATSRREVAFIPARFAVVGKVLRIEGEDGWTVANAYPHSATTDHASMHAAHKRFERILEPHR